jgi:hypothetical protein
VTARELCLHLQNIPTLAINLCNSHIVVVHFDTVQQLMWRDSVLTVLKLHTLVWFGRNSGASQRVSLCLWSENLLNRKASILDFNTKVERQPSSPGGSRED